MKMKIRLYLIGMMLFGIGVFACLCGDWKWVIYQFIGFGIILIGDETH